MDVDSGEAPKAEICFVPSLQLCFITAYLDFDHEKETVERNACLEQDRMSAEKRICCDTSVESQDHRSKKWHVRSPHAPRGVPNGG